MAIFGEKFKIGRPLGIRWLFVLSFIPTILISSLFLYVSYEGAQTHLEERALHTARTLSHAIDRDVAGIMGKLQVLATSESMQNGDLQAFYRRCKSVMSAEDRGELIALIDDTGQQVINTLRPFGSALPKTGHPEPLPRLFESGQPNISDLYIGGVTKRHMVAIEVPVMRDGKVIYRLAMAVPAQRLNKLLLGQHQPNGWVVALFDSQATVITRTLNPDQFTGNRATPDLQAEMAKSHEGAMASHTLEGVPSFVAFSRSSETGWTVTVALTRNVLYENLYRPMLVVGLGIFGFLFAGAILGARFGRQVREALQALLAATEAATAGDLNAKAQLMGPSELVQLANQFNRMQETRREAQLVLRIAAVAFEAHLGIVITDARGLVLRTNQAFATLTGYSAEETLGRKLSFLKSGRHDADFYSVMWERIARDGLWQGEIWNRHQDGQVSPHLLTVSAITVEDGTMTHYVGSYIDLTERKQAELLLQRLTRALGLLSACNRMLSNSNDEQELIDEVCRLVVNTGRYAMAWVGFAENDPEKTVRICGCHGDTNGYLADINLTWSDSDSGRGPSGTAIREGITIVNQNFRTNPAVAPWRDKALAHGFQSSIALPLIHLGAVVGILSIYSQAPDAFSANEVRLLEDMANDLSVGIVALRARQSHLQAEIALHQSEERLRSLFNSIRDAIFVMTLRDDGSPGHFVDVNQVACERLGYSRDELLRMGPYDIDAPECMAEIPRLTEQLVGDGHLLFDRIQVTKDGRLIPVEVSASTFQCQQQTMVMAIARDISSRQQADTERLAHKGQLQKLSAHLLSVREEERSHIARELHDQFGQMLTALKIDISRLVAMVPADKAALGQFSDTLDIVDELIASVRKLAVALRPIMLDELGLKAALDYLVRSFGKRYVHIECKLACIFDEDLLNDEQTITVYRIVQECMTNIVKHAEANKVHIAVSMCGQQELIVSVQDNGCGMTENDKLNGFGLLGIRERVRALGGGMDVSSIPGEGVTIDVIIPLTPLTGGGECP